MIKKFLVFFCLSICCFSFAFALTQNKDEQDSNVVLFSSEQENKDKYVLEQEVKEQKDCTVQLKKAKEYYYNVNLEIAESCVNDVLVLQPDNEKANELKNKILLLKEKEAYYKKALIEDYFIELRRTIKDGNYYEGLLFIKKIKDLSPEENVDSFYNRLISEEELVLSTIENQSDKDILKKSVDAFVNEKFIKSTKLICKLYEKYPKFADFVGMSRYYTIRETNNKRVKIYYNEAQKYLRASKLGKARVSAEIAYSLQPENVKLKILIDQINMEII